MEKTRDLLKKIRDTKGKFHAKMGSIKDKDGLNKGQKWYGSYRSRILRRDGKNTQKNYKKRVTQIAIMV